MATTHRAARSPTSPLINLSKLSDKAPRLRIPASNHWAVTRSPDRRTIVFSAFKGPDVVGPEWEVHTTRLHALARNTAAAIAVLLLLVGAAWAGNAF